MDWFERLTGFRETSYEDTRRQLEIVDGRLRSSVNGQSYAIGKFELLSLETLRECAQSDKPLPGRLKVSVVEGDVGQLHRSPEYTGALFQVASQFNVLEMVSPNVTPEDGVTRYEHDRTQGPACAIAAGAGTIYRNYFVPVENQCGQTKTNQLDGLSELGAAFSKALRMPREALWTMRNGYALCTREGIDAISRLLASLSPDETQTLRCKLCIGLHWNVEVTGAPGANRPLVSQAFCSALPVSYSGVPRQHWPAFASLILEAAYEATMWAGVCNAQRGGSNQILLTRLGGGAFGNDDQWIDAAILSALQKSADLNLDVKIVSYGPPSRGVLEVVDQFR